MPRKAAATTRKSTAAKSRRTTAAKPAEAPAKRPVGRPRKNAAPVEIPAKATPAKRGPGRPRKEAPAPVKATRAPRKTAAVPQQRTAPASESTYYGFTPEFLKGLRALVDAHGIGGMAVAGSDSVNDDSAADADAKHTREELDDMGVRSLRTLAIKMGFDPTEVKTTDKETLVENIFEAEHEDDDEDDDDQDDDSDSDADADDEDDEDSDDDSDDEDDDEDENDDDDSDDDDDDPDVDDEDDDEGEDDESDRLTEAELRKMTLPNLRKVLVADGFEAADLKGADKDELIAWYMEADGDEDQDDDADVADEDDDEDVYTRDDLEKMADGELKEMARLNGVKLPKGAKKSEIIDLLLADDDE